MLGDMGDMSLSVCRCPTAPSPLNKAYSGSMGVKGTQKQGRLPPVSADPAPCEGQAGRVAATLSLSPTPPALALMGGKLLREGAA